MPSVSNSFASFRFCYHYSFSCTTEDPLSNGKDFGLPRTFKYPSSYIQFVAEKLRQEFIELLERDVEFRY
ncbi:MAG: hypothetical protein QXP99_03455, partial [Thermoproteota archaeon]